MKAASNAALQGGSIAVTVQEGITRWARNECRANAKEELAWKNARPATENR